MSAAKLSIRLGPVQEHILMIGICGWSLWVQTQYRLLGDFSLLWLPFASIALGILTAVLWLTRLIGKAAIEAGYQKLFAYVQSGAQLFVVGFFIYSVFLLANAQLDTSTPKRLPSQLLEIKRGRFDIGYSIPYYYAKVAGWKDSDGDKWLLINSVEQERLWFKQAVALRLYGGYFGVPWIKHIEPDPEKQLRSALAAAPGASALWKELITHYIQNQQWAEAAQASRELLHVYPNQSQFMEYVAGSLLNARAYDEMLGLLEPVIKRSENYQIFICMGFAMAMRNRKPEGLKLLQRATELEPKDYFGYYALANAHFFTGDKAAALPYYEKVLQMRPRYPEVLERVQMIRAARQRPPTS